VRVLVSGATGFIGAALVGDLEAARATVHRLVRGEPGPGDAGWGPDAAGPIDTSQLPGRSLDGLDAVVHLAGAPIAGERWNEDRRDAIRSSRVGTTATLAEALAQCSQPPKVLVSASAVGYYGNGGDAELTEDHPAGSGFLAGLCRDWEAAADPARAAGIRVAHPRTGVVLGPGGGVLAPLLRLFRDGLGGRLGNGRQWMAWVSLEDTLRALSHAIEHDFEGPFNVASPAPATNADFTRALGHALHRPAALRVPAFALRTILGAAAADELLLASQRALPAKLTASGFAFVHPTLETALAAALTS